MQGTEIDRDEEIRRLAYKFCRRRGVGFNTGSKPREYGWKNIARKTSLKCPRLLKGEDEDKPALLTGELTRLTTQAKLRRRLPPIPIRPTLG